MCSWHLSTDGNDPLSWGSVVRTLPPFDWLHIPLINVPEGFYLFRYCNNKSLFTLVVSWKLAVQPSFHVALVLLQHTLYALSFLCLITMLFVCLCVCCQRITASSEKAVAGGAKVRPFKLLTCESSDLGIFIAGIGRCQ